MEDNMTQECAELSIYAGMLAAGAEGPRPDGPNRCS
jgi:hypothetical protein